MTARLIEGLAGAASRLGAPALRAARPRFAAFFGAAFADFFGFFAPRFFAPARFFWPTICPSALPKPGFRIDAARSRYGFRLSISRPASKKAAQCLAPACGFGRRAPETIPELLRIHAEVAELD